MLRAIPDEVVYRNARADAPRTARPRAAASARRSRAGPARGDPRRGDDRPAPVGAARAALARRRLGRAAHPCPQHVRARRALRPKASPTSRRAARCRWPTVSPASSTAGPSAPSYRGDDDLVFAHPQTGNRRSTAPRSPSASRRPASTAEVRPVSFHDLRHTFATRLAASGQPMRTIQEFLGHADSKTTQIYAHYAPSEHEVQMVNEAFTGSAASPPDVPSDAVR